MSSCSWFGTIVVRVTAPCCHLRGTHTVQVLVNYLPMRLPVCDFQSLRSRSCAHPAEFGLPGVPNAHETDHIAEFRVEKEHIFRDEDDPSDDLPMVTLEKILGRPIRHRALHTWRFFSCVWPVSCRAHVPIEWLAPLTCRSAAHSALLSDPRRAMLL